MGHAAAARVATRGASSAATVGRGVEGREDPLAVRPLIFCTAAPLSLAHWTRTPPAQRPRLECLAGAAAWVWSAPDGARWHHHGAARRGAAAVGAAAACRHRATRSAPRGHPSQRHGAAGRHRGTAGCAGGPRQPPPHRNPNFLGRHSREDGRGPAELGQNSAHGLVRCGPHWWAGHRGGETGTQRPLHQRAQHTQAGTHSSLVDGTWDTCGRQRLAIAVVVAVSPAATQGPLSSRDSDP